MRKQQLGSLTILRGMTQVAAWMPLWVALAAAFGRARMLLPRRPHCQPASFPYRCTASLTSCQTATSSGWWALQEGVVEPRTRRGCRVCGTRESRSLLAAAGVISTVISTYFLLVPKVQTPDSRWHTQVSSATRTHLTHPSTHLQSRAPPRPHDAHLSRRPQTPARPLCGCVCAFLRPTQTQRGRKGHGETRQPRPSLHAFPRLSARRPPRRQWPQAPSRCAPCRGQPRQS